MQSFLAAHPQVLSFPETAVFARLLIGPQSSTPSASDAAARIEASYARATAFLDSVERRDLDRLLPRADASIVEFAHAFVAVLDRLTLDRGKISWVEKTPKHLALVSEIRNLVPGGRFINVLRDGRQNIASLYEAALKHPNVWWRAGRGDLDQALNRWNESVRHTRALRNVAEVLLIRYERLISDTETVLREICAFAGLHFKPEMIERRSEAARTVVTAAEPWKVGVLGTLRRAPDDKFGRLFSVEQKAYIEARLEQIDF